MKRWANKHGEYGGRIESPAAVERFLDAIEAVCREHGFSLSHEDGHGAFEIEEFDPYNIEWLRAAHLNIEVKP